MHLASEHRIHDGMRFARSKVPENMHRGEHCSIRLGMRYPIAAGSMREQCVRGRIPMRPVGWIMQGNFRGELRHE